MPNLNDLIQSTFKKTIEEIFFSDDYRNLNNLCFLLEKKRGFEKELEALLPVSLTSNSDELIAITKLHTSIDDCTQGLLEVDQEKEKEKIREEKESYLIAVHELYQLTNLNEETAKKIQYIQKSLEEIRRTIEEKKEYFATIYRNLLLKKCENAWQKKVFTDFIVFQKDFPRSLKNLFESKIVVTEFEHDKNLFISYLVQYQTNFLPLEYNDWETDLPSEQKFPSSKEHRTSFGFGHVMPCFTAKSKGKIIASCAPFKNTIRGKEKENDKTLQNFLRLLFDEIEIVIEIGDDADTRADYKKCSLFSHKTSKKDNQILIIEEVGASQKKHIHHIHLNAMDQHPVYLSNEDILELLRITHSVKTGSSALIHCSSGVGRTGQLCLMLSMLDFLKNNDVFRNQLIQFALKSEAMSEGKIVLLIQETFNQMKTLLKKLRGVRYSIEQPSQFLAVFYQILLLAVAEKRFMMGSPENIFKKELDNVRKKFMIPSDEKAEKKDASTTVQVTREDSVMMEEYTSPLYMSPTTALKGDFPSDSDTASSVLSSHGTFPEHFRQKIAEASETRKSMVEKLREATDATCDTSSSVLSKPKPPAQPRPLSAGKNFFRRCQPQESFEPQECLDSEDTSSTYSTP